jgi:ribosomal protein S18 acetylase RimI-like enzyme
MHWSEAAREARNAAFRDHWGSQPINAELWDSFVARSILRPDLSFLAIATADDGTEEVAGLVMSSVNEEDWEGQGFSSAYIDIVGVTRDWRGRGVAAALLARTLRAIALAGLVRAVLDVDLDSPTGALGLYTGAGFVEAGRGIIFIREF